MVAEYTKKPYRRSENRPRRAGYGRGKRKRRQAVDAERYARKYLGGMIDNYWFIERQRIRAIRKQLIAENGPICAICGKRIYNPKDITVDHIKPKDKGGQTTLSNCQLAHFKCNRDKGNIYDKKKYPPKEEK